MPPVLIYILMYKYLIFLFLLFSIRSYTQNLEPIIEKHHSGCVTIFNIEFIDDELWATGWHTDTGEGVIWKHDQYGNFIDSTIIDEMAIQLIYGISEYKDSALIIGVGSPDDENWKMFVKCYDKQLNELWSKSFDLDYYPFVYDIRLFRNNNKYIISLQCSNSHFFVFDEKFNFISDFKSNNQYNCEPIKFTDNGYLFAKDLRFIVELDTLFNEIDTIVERNNLLADGGDFMSVGEKYISAARSADRTNSIKFWNSDFELLNNYPYFGNITEFGRPRYTYFRDIAPNRDTSKLFLSGIINQNQDPHNVFLGSNNPNKFWVAYADRDSLLWYKYYGDSINYYFASDMAIGPDGSLYLAASRYNAVEQPEYNDAVIFRISKEGEFLVGETNDITQAIEPKIYPNPGKNYLQIEIPDYAEAIIQMYDLQGKIVQVDNFTHKTRLTTEVLNEGIYFYRITTKKGEVYNGKWIKR